MSDRYLDEILVLLSRHRQRATYGAVAAVVARPATFLMGGRPRNHQNSWIVSKATSLPTGYDADELHPDLQMHPRVLATSHELEQWIAEVRAEPTSH